ncbi:hypothetical protein [Streptomyces sp. WAC 04229]|uniref:hypothetical protein n=1 Tax=Streptomyces sp. WAC 04229 TaxID=2203206 RepID=UPI003D717176
MKEVGDGVVVRVRAEGGGEALYELLAAGCVGAAGEFEGVGGCVGGGFDVVVARWLAAW